MLSFAEKHFGKENILSYQSLAKAGSDRTYARIVTKDKSYIICEHHNPKENESFIHFANHFKKFDLPVPEIIAYNPDATIYIQEDLGQDDLLHLVNKNGFNSSIKDLYKKSLQQLAKLQIIAGKDFDYSKCYASKKFDTKAVLADLNYFKYYFLDLQKIEYNKPTLQEELERLSEQVAHSDPQCFMYRDFQGRNIMIKNNEPYFIDFQGGMKGPIQYDVASLLWQAKANLNLDWKNELLDYYMECVKQYMPIDEQQFKTNYSYILLVRLLQVLGAYGLRGIIEKRPHFIASIPFGLQNIIAWQSQYSLALFPTLSTILDQLSSPSLTQKYTHPMSNQDSKLQIVVQSFSYKKGIPKDESGNGGGFVFDCRGLLNPGRFDEYKKLTGRDQPVIDFLNEKTKIHEFLQAAKDIVSINIDDYLSRGFEHLQINFGCTGGQHRSVFSADQIAAFIQDKYHLIPTVNHIEQESKAWLNG